MLCNRIVARLHRDDQRTLPPYVSNKKKFHVVRLGIQKGESTHVFSLSIACSKLCLRESCDHRQSRSIEQKKYTVSVSSTLLLTHSSNLSSVQKQSLSSISGISHSLPGPFALPGENCSQPVPKLCSFSCKKKAQAVKMSVNVALAGDTDRKLHSRVLSPPVSCLLTT